MADNRRVDFNDLRRRADFRAVLAHYGLSPVGNGEQVKVRCPFHPDDEPSCSVNLGKRVYHCFGCRAAGNVLEFVHRMENRDGEAVTLRRAGILLAEVCGIEPGATDVRRGARKAKDGPSTPEAQEGPSARSEAPPRASGGPGRAPGKAAAPKANKPLGFALTLDPGHPYLAGRGIAPGLVELFGLGYCEKGIMAGRVCIPIQNGEGRTVAYAGRWVGPDEGLPEGKGKYELPAGFRKELELFNLHRVAHCRHLVVVEGYFGAIRLHGAKIPAVALMGSSLAAGQVGLLRRHCPQLRFVTVMLDGDDAGREAADIVATQLAKRWWSRIVHLAEGKQPDTVRGPELEQLLGRGQGQ